MQISNCCIYYYICTRVEGWVPERELRNTLWEGKRSAGNSVVGYTTFSCRGVLNLLSPSRYRRIQAEWTGFQAALT